MSIPTTFRAAVADSFGPTLDVRSIPIPEPAEHQALVRLLASGICHTDLHAAEGDWPVKPGLPFVPGHEGIGEVVAVGPGVTEAAVGDIVGNAWLWSACGTCEFCITGRETFCHQAEYGGYTMNGSFGEYMLVDSRYAARIPKGVTNYAEAAPILCAGITVYKGLKVADTRPGQFMVVSGIGGLGHLAVQYAAAMGMRVIAVDIEDAKLDLARSHGAEFAVNARIDDPGAAVLDYTDGGAHGVLVTAVHESAFRQALDMARRGGTAVFTGLPPGEFPAPIFDIVFKGITIRGSLVGTRQDMAEALDYYARGLVTPTVTECSLDDVNDVFDRMRRGTIDGRYSIKY